VEGEGAGDGKPNASRPARHQRRFAPQQVPSDGDTTAAFDHFPSPTAPALAIFCGFVCCVDLAGARQVPMGPFFGRVAPPEADAFPLHFVQVRGGSVNKTRQPELHRRRKNERGLWVGGYN
jgi:hypothetical protein